MPTQIKACLQECLLEANLLSEFSEFKFVLRDDILEVFTTLKGSDSIVTFNHRRLIREYFHFLLPWPKKRNNEMRHHVNYMVKYFSFFSKVFQCLYYGDKIFQTANEIPNVTGEYCSFANPNLSFLNSKTVKDGYTLLNEAIPAEMKEFLKLARYFMFLEFDPRDAKQVRLLCSILSLLIIGGYGRADKWTLAPKSSTDQHITEKIADHFYDRLI